MNLVLKDDANYVWLQKGVMLKSRYEIKEKISVSDLSIVYMGYDYLEGQSCIIKEYYPKGKVLRDMDGKTVVFKMPSFKHRYYEGVDVFFNEARILMKYNHRNLAKCIDHFNENDTGYIVMKYYEGKTLDVFLDEEKDIPIPDLFKNIFIPLVSAVNQIHKKGVIHRDIKPKNIIINKNFGPIIIDFGSACSFRKSQKTKIFYSPGFSPLEFYSDKSRQGKYSDIYSVAATLYYFLCKRPPEKVTDRVIEDKIQHVRKYNKDISSFFSNIIMKNLSVDYKKRFSSLWLFKLIMYFEYVYLRKKS